MSKTLDSNNLILVVCKFSYLNIKNKYKEWSKINKVCQNKYNQLLLNINKNNNR
jgi:hypothetical protein